MQTSLLPKIDFGNEAGDDADPQELISYFVEQSMFREFVLSKHKVLIATAKKGVGKSALIQWINHRLESTDPEAIVIKCRGADLSRGRFNLNKELKTPSDHIRDWMIRICAIVNRHLAAKIHFAATDDQITLVESAELDGFKSRNLVGCLLERFTRLLDKYQPSKVAAKDEIELLKRVSTRKLWILIDDLDATFQNTNAECLDLGTFFSACRYLTQDVQDVCFRVTLRTDVWPIVRRYDEAQDKTEQYVREILWSQADFRRLLYKRIKSQADILALKLPNFPPYYTDEECEEAILKLAFVPKTKWGDHESYTYRVIYTLSYHRPRWAVQLCKLAQGCAVKRGDQLISKDHIDDVWGQFGQKRISDLVSEHKHQCSVIEELINGFRGCERLMTRNSLVDWIEKHITNHMTPVVDGNEVRSPTQVGHFLYRIGFIVAKSEDDVSGGYEHYHFSDMPDFLTSRTNQDFDVKWEIHPCYREALDIQKINRSQRIKKGAAKLDSPRILMPASLLPKFDRLDSCKTWTVTSIAEYYGRKPAEILAFLVKNQIFKNSNDQLKPHEYKIVEQYYCEGSDDVGRV